MPNHLYIFDRFIFYCIPFYLALHINYFAAIPWLSAVSLTGRSLQKAEGIIPMIFIIIFLTITVIYHGYYLYKTNFLKKYLSYYIPIIIIVLIIPVLLSLYFHWHHAMLALILIPLTRFKLRFSLIIQAGAIGFMVHGISRWGANLSPYDTAWQYFNGDPMGFKTPEFITTTNQSQFISWDYELDNGTKILLADYENIDGYSLLMNDVEVYRGRNNNFTISDNLFPSNDSLVYVRVAAISDGATRDYSDPLTFYKNGTKITLENLL
jgi:hypothetical protein